MQGKAIIWWILWTPARSLPIITKTMNWASVRRLTFLGEELSLQTWMLLPKNIIGKIMQNFFVFLSLLDLHISLIIFSKKYGLDDFTPLTRPRKADEIYEKIERYIPPYNGFGSYEDSLGNCFTVMPKPPKSDFIKFLYHDK